MVKNIAPLILTLSHKNIGVRWITEKTAQKTLEQGVLWEVHAHTHKEIESDPKIPIKQLTAFSGWYSASIDEEQFVRLSVQDQARISHTSPLAVNNQQQAIEYHLKQTDTIYSMLTHLETIIQARKQTLPEGSYTTHLFSKGQEKIKKKVGEEAIEVLLSRSTTETVNESADLLYHLFVMLIDLDISPQLVVEELMNRHTK